MGFLRLLRIGLSTLALAAVVGAVAPSAASASSTSDFNGLRWGSGPQTITVVSYAHTSWNISAVLAAWDRSSAISIRTASSCNYQVSNCVFIRTGSYGRNIGWIGNAVSYRFSNTHTLAYVNIYLNDSQGFSSAYMAGTARGRSQTMSHEFGHALGLAHRDGASVMRSSITGAYPYPTSIDYANVARLY